MRWFSAQRLRVALLALGVFALDTVTDVDIVIPVLYVNVVLIARRSGRRSDIAIAGWGSVALTIFSFVLTVRPEVPATTALLNTALSLLAILCVTVLCLKSVRSEEEIIRTRDRLAAVSRGFFLRTLSASVAREVTEPIAAIGVNAAAACRALSEARPDLDQAKIATRRIVEDVERVSAVVGRLRGSIASRGMACVLCDTQTVIEHAVAHLGFALRDAGIDITLSLAPDLKIIADRELIEQVIADVLANAVEALRAVAVGRRCIKVETRALPGEVCISIEDNSVGVEEKTLDRLFDAFFAIKVGSGTGIGLAVSKSIIEVHDGTIRALPHAPTGLIVEIRLPVAGTVLA